MILPIQNISNGKLYVYNETNFKNRVHLAKTVMPSINRNATNNFSSVLFNKIKDFMFPTLKRNLYLKSNWEKITKNLGVSITFEEIFNAYNNKNRKYHNLDHIYNVLKNIDEYEKRNVYSEDNSYLLRYSAFMHDFYQGEDDVVRSAEKASENFKPEYTIRNLLVRHMIRATDHTRPLREGTTDFEKILKDADLAILGSSKKDYKKYLKQIRKENIQISDLEYAKKRIEFLEKLSYKKDIYKTSFFKNKYELNAQNNIKSEIEQLRKIYN